MFFAQRIRNARVCVWSGEQKVTIKINQNTIFLFITQFTLISSVHTAHTHTYTYEISYTLKGEA